MFNGSSAETQSDSVHPAGTRRRDFDGFRKDATGLPAPPISGRADLPSEAGETF
jgi:hypothetical protein